MAWKPFYTTAHNIAKDKKKLKSESVNKLNLTAFSMVNTIESIVRLWCFKK